MDGKLLEIPIDLRYMFRIPQPSNSSFQVTSVNIAPPEQSTCSDVITGKHWTILSLGHSGTAHQILIDTHRFKGNYPESCLIEGASLLTSAFDLAENNSDQIHWFTLIPRTKLGPDREVTLSVVEECMGKRVTHVRVTMFPDGGISRIRVFGRICD